LGLFKGRLNTIKSQELILNNDFEIYNDCPIEHTPETGDLKEIIPDWTNLGLKCADYFNKCAKGDASVPKNFAGISDPYSGNGYLGMILQGSKSTFREYIQGKLIVPLKKQEDYIFSINIQLASYSHYALNRFGVYFSTESEIIDKKTLKNINKSKDYVLNFIKPTLEVDSISFIDNNNSWRKINWLYTAEGGERFITLGNFYDSINTELKVIDENLMNLRYKTYSYYYIDNVSLQRVPTIKSIHYYSENGDNYLITSDSLKYEIKSNDSGYLYLHSENQIYKLNVDDVDINISDKRIKFVCHKLEGKIFIINNTKSEYIPALYIEFESTDEIIKFKNNLKINFAQSSRLPIGN